MSRYLAFFILIISTVVDIQGLLQQYPNPPHCTKLIKTTDYQYKYKYDYPTVYIPPGQREAYQHLYCVNPPTVNQATTTVCDWAAPPQVQFTLGDEYMHVVRQDPTGRFLGNAVITTLQLCNHNRTVNESTPIIVEDLLKSSELDD